MKRTVIFLLTLLLVFSLAIGVSATNQLPPKIADVAPLSTPIIDNIILQTPTIAGEFASLTIHVQNGDALTNNVVVTVDPVAPHMDPITVNIGTMQPNQGQHILLYLNYPQPGIFTGNINLNYQGGNNNYPYTANVQSNPIPTAPIVYEIPDIEFEENDQYVLDLSEYVTDVNGDSISWTSTSQEPNIQITINGQIATFTATTNWNGNSEGQFHANDGMFTVDSNMFDMVVYPVNQEPTMLTFTVSPDSVVEGEDFTATGTFDDPDDPLLFYGVSSSSNMNNCNQNDQTGCLCYFEDVASPQSCDFNSNLLGVGTYSIYSHVCDTYECSNILFDSVTIQDSTPQMNTFSVTPETAYEYETFTATGTFIDNDDPTVFYGVSTSGSMTDCNQNTQTGCLCNDLSTASPGSCTFLGSDVGVGLQTIYSHVCDVAECSNILSDSITVNDEAPVMNTFSVSPDPVFEDGTVTATGTFTDPNDPNVFFGTSSSSSMTNCNQNTQTGCLCEDLSTSSPGMCTFSANLLNVGSNTVYSHVCDTDECSNILSDTITVTVVYTVSGTVTNIFTTNPVSGALVEIVDDGTTRSDTTDSNGDYSINVYTQDYLVTTITKSGYTPRHTWADTNSGTVTEDYTLVPLTFVWDLYNDGFRGNLYGQITGYGMGNMQWPAPPDIVVFSDNSLVGGQSLTNNINTMMYNLEFILPTFNPRDALFSNVAQESSFRPAQDDELRIYWDNGIPGVGVAGIIPNGNGPQILQASTAYKYTIHPTNPDNAIYNQELGTTMGATDEPPQSAAYTSVFTDPPGSSTYTSDDYDCSEVYLDRSRIHYINSGYTGENSYDWEIRPDLVVNYYPNGKGSKVKEHFIYYIFYEDGTRTQTTYNFNEVPEDVKKHFPMMFPEYLNKKAEITKITKVEEVEEKVIEPKVKYSSYKRTKYSDKKEVKEIKTYSGNGRNSAGSVTKANDYKPISR